MDETDTEVSAGDAAALADAIEEGADDLRCDVSPMLEFLRSGGFRLVYPE
jgi:hypothetical protein